MSVAIGGVPSIAPLYDRIVLHTIYAHVCDDNYDFVHLPCWYQVVSKANDAKGALIDLVRARSWPAPQFTHYTPPAPVLHAAASHDTSRDAYHDSASPGSARTLCPGCHTPLSAYARALPPELLLLTLT